MLRFPELELRDLRGRTRPSPSVFDGKWNLVFVAFRRRHQSLIDEWLRQIDGATEGVALWEVPAISGMWSPARGFIDGGMAAGVGTIEVQERTLTYYGDLRRLTGPLEISTRDTITTLLLDGSGAVVDRAAGPFDQDSAERLLAHTQLGGVSD